MFEENFDGYDSSYRIVFVGEWSDWEENGWLFIFEKDNRFYFLQGSHCVMTINNRYSFKNIQEITSDEALELMEEWADDETTADYSFLDPCIFY